MKMKNKNIIILLIVVIVGLVVFIFNEQGNKTITSESLFEKQEDMCR